MISITRHRPKRFVCFCMRSAIVIYILSVFIYLSGWPVIMTASYLAGLEIRAGKNINRLGPESQAVNNHKRHVFRIPHYDPFPTAVTTKLLSLGLPQGLNWPRVAYQWNSIKGTAGGFTVVLNVCFCTSQ